MQCSHNKNGECLGKMPKQCNDYPVPEYLSRDQLLAVNAPTEDDIKFWEFCNNQQEDDVCIEWDQ
jgi:hypothetical protein